MRRNSIGLRQGMSASGPRVDAGAGGGGGGGLAQVLVVLAVVAWGGARSSPGAAEAAPAVPPAAVPPAAVPPAAVPPAAVPPAAVPPAAVPPAAVPPTAVPAAGAETGPASEVTGPDSTRMILPESPEFRGKRVTIAPGDIEAIEFVRFLANFTGLPVIVDTGGNPQILNTPITVVARMQDVTADVVVAILQANRWLVTREQLPSGEIILKIESAQAGVPQAGGEVTATPLIRVADGRASRIEPEVSPEFKDVKPDEIATMVFTLKHTQPADAISSLNSLIGGVKGVRSKAFNIVDVKNSMLVIVTAKFGLLPFIQELLTLIDVPIKEPERLVQILDVENADADELVALIDQFLQGRSGIGGRTTRTVAPIAPGTPPGTAAQLAGRSGDYGTNLIADWRTQKIIVETYNERHLEDIHMLVRELDTRFDIRRLKTRIYQVKYLKADEVASDLSLLIGQSTAGLSGRAGLGARTSTRSTRTTGVARVGRTGQAGAPTPGVVPGAGGTGGAPMPAVIVPHPQTNSLIIQAEPEEYAEILNILDQIDVKRRQVFLEAALVQVSTDSSLNYTIELLAGQPSDIGTRALFESSFGLSGLDFQNWNRLIPDTLDAASVPPGALLAVMNRGKFPALISFFKRSSDSQVLATPFILADDNQTNVIDILETIFVQNTSTGSSQVTTTSQEGEDAGITLEITPTISSKNAVFLEMTLEVSQFTGQGTAQVLPPKSTNNISSAVTIPDGELFVIGGLTRETKSKAVSKVPIIGDIPLIGKLFRSESTSKNASNLYIFLRAHVLSHPAFLDGYDLTQQADTFVRKFAPDINYARFDRPDVKFPEAIPPDRDDPLRLYRTRAEAPREDERQRSHFPEGREAPQGAYRSVHELPASDSRTSYQGGPAGPYGAEPESPPDAGTASVRPVPRGARSDLPGGLSRPPESEIPELEPTDIKPGGPELPARGPSPATTRQPPGPQDVATPDDALGEAGLEVDRGGESWLIPVRERGTGRASGNARPGIQVDPSRSWLGVERE